MWVELAEKVKHLAEQGTSTSNCELREFQSQAHLMYFCWSQVSFNDRQKIPSKFQPQCLKGWKILCTRKCSKGVMWRVASLEVASLKRSCYARLLDLTGQEIWTPLLTCGSFKSCSVTESIMQVTSIPTSLANLFSVLFPKVQALRLSGYILVDKILPFTMFFKKR